MKASLPTTPEMRFLEACVKHKEATHDNSDYIPAELKKPYPGVSHAPIWRSYLKCKFTFLNSDQSAEAERIAQRKAQRVGLSEGKAKQFVSVWRKTARFEETAFFYRIIQLSTEVAENSYDTTIPEVRAWCKRNEQKYESLENEIRKQQLGSIEKFKEQADIVKVRFGFMPSDHIFDCLTEQLTKELTKTIFDKEKDYNDALTHVSSGSPYVPTWTAEDLKHPFLKLRDFLVNTLTIRLTKSLLDNGHDETEVIRTFLYEVKKLFGCDVCDYLDVVGKLGEEEKLVLRVATLSYDELTEDFKRDVDRDRVSPNMQESETYGKGEGITGSVLLLNQAAAQDFWSYHIGSNDVKQDPRQSKAHLSAYEEAVYPNLLSQPQGEDRGKIVNFWVFPIYFGSKIIGAFRVVNKVTSTAKRKHIIDWSFVDRVQLSIIATWFSSFLETLNPYIYSSDDWFVILRRERAIKILIEDQGLGWTEPRIIKAIITHLFKDIGKKIEKRRVGCCIFLTANPAKMLHKFEDYPLIDVDTDSTGIAYPYDGNIDKFHDAVNPSLGGYVLAHDGAYHSIIRLSKKAGKSPFHPRDVSRIVPKTICFLLERGSKTVNVYVKGDKVAEVFVSEYTGEWVLRFPKQIRSRMKELVPKGNKMIDIIADVCLDLSGYNYGGIFVFGPNRELETAFDKHLEKREAKIKYRVGEEKIDSIGQAILMELSKIDGATFINYNGTVVDINFVIRVRDYNEGAMKTQKTANQLDDKNSSIRKRGARHTAGISISRVCPTSLVIIVSENGGISLVRGGNVEASEL